jgi:drug/metabolite transporter (DMT)-like permease
MVTTVASLSSWLFFFIVIVVWQAFPFIPVAIGMLERSVSVPTCVLAASIAGVGTYWSWHIGTTDTSSSTASLIVLWSPLYLAVPVGAVIGLDVLFRRRLRSRREHQGVN